MKKVAVATDSNSGITARQAEEKGVYVLPMPFFINGQTYFEELDLTQEQFYRMLEEDVEISTSMPAVADVTDFWDRLLQEYDEVVYIPMSSGLSGSCGAAVMLSQEYDGRVQVVNNHRISVILKQAVWDAKTMADHGMAAVEIKASLEASRYETSIYIMVDTLSYLKKGGRVTPAAAALGTLLKIKPILQLQGEKLDAFAKARTARLGKSIMLESMKKDFAERFGDPAGETLWLQAAYTKDLEKAEEWKKEIMVAFPGHDVLLDPLSLSVSCHIGPGALAIACCKKLQAL